MDLSEILDEAPKSSKEMPSLDELISMSTTEDSDSEDETMTVDRRLNIKMFGPINTMGIFIESYSVKNISRVIESCEKFLCPISDDIVIDDTFITTLINREKSSEYLLKYYFVLCDDPEYFTQNISDNLKDLYQCNRLFFYASQWKNENNLFRFHQILRMFSMVPPEFKSFLQSMAIIEDNMKIIKEINKVRLMPFVDAYRKNKEQCLTLVKDFTVTTYKTPLETNKKSCCYMSELTSDFIKYYTVTRRKINWFTNNLIVGRVDKVTQLCYDIISMIDYDVSQNRIADLGLKAYLNTWVTRNFMKVHAASVSYAWPLNNNDITNSDTNSDTNINKKSKEPKILVDNEYTVKEYNNKVVLQLVQSLAAQLKTLITTMINYPTMDIMLHIEKPSVYNQSVFMQFNKISPKEFDMYHKNILLTSENETSYDIYGLTKENGPNIINKLIPISYIQAAHKFIEQIKLVHARDIVQQDNDDNSDLESDSSTESPKLSYSEKINNTIKDLKICAISIAASEYKDHKEELIERTISIHEANLNSKDHNTNSFENSNVIWFIFSDDLVYCEKRSLFKSLKYINFIDMDIAELAMIFDKEIYEKVIFMHCDYHIYFDHLSYIFRQLGDVAPSPKPPSGSDIEGKKEGKKEKLYNDKEDVLEEDEDF